MKEWCIKFDAPFFMVDIEDLYLKQILALLKTKNKSDYCALLGIGLCLNFNIKDNNANIDIVRNLINKNIRDNKIIKEFIFLQWNGDEVIN